MQPVRRGTTDETRATTGPLPVPPVTAAGSGMPDPAEPPAVAAAGPQDVVPAPGGPGVRPTSGELPRFGDAASSDPQGAGFLEAILDGIADPVFVKGQDHRYILGNLAFGKMVGVPLGVIRDRRDTDFFPADQAALFARQDDLVLGAGVCGVYEEAVSFADGTVRTVVTKKTLYTDAQGRRFVVGVVRDITGRKQTEEALRESEAKYREVVENAAEAIVVVQDGMFAFVNRAACRWTLCRPEDLQGRPFLELVHPDDREMVVRRHRRRLAGEAVESGYPIRVLAAGNQVRWIEVNAARIEWAGRPATLNLLTDITERAQAEERAARADKLEAIGALAGGIAHDFNNILSAIVGHTQMALRKCADHPEIQQDLEIVLQGTRRATDLVRQILAFSRRTAPAAAPVEVGRIVKEASTFLRASIPTTIAILTDIRSTASVLADPIEIHRIVVNLCTNASLAMSDGGELDLGLEDVELDASFTDQHPEMTPGPFVRLTVRDTGHGMSPEVLARIFEPFFTTREEGKGTGMGLSVVRGIIANLHGAITVASAVGRGTTFAVYFPVTHAAAAADEPVAAEARHGTERVLVVDDDQLVRETVVDMLGELGYQVRSAADGKAALAMIEADPAAVDLVVTDLTMPGMTGIVLAGRLKALRSDLPIILCSGNSESVPPELARREGVNAMLNKPILLTDLSRLVRGVLEH